MLGGGFRGNQLEGPPEPSVEIESLGSAREAILSVGTNALPMLVRMLAGGQTPIDRWKRVLVEKCGLPQRLIRTNNWMTSWENVTRALAAFHTLGSNSAPAAGRIVPLLNDPDSAGQAIVALMLIRPEREDHILSLTNVSRLRRASRSGGSPDLIFSMALLALGAFGPKAAGAIPILVDRLSSTNERIQATAAVALVRVGAPAELAVPLIVKTLPKTDPTPPELPPGAPPMPTYVSEVLMKIWALEQYGAKARAALPMLSILEQYRTGNFREAARKASATIRGEKYLPPSTFD